MKNVLYTKLFHGKTSLSNNFYRSFSETILKFEMYSLKVSHKTPFLFRSVNYFFSVCLTENLLVFSVLKIVFTVFKKNPEAYVNSVCMMVISSMYSNVKMSEKAIIDVIFTLKKTKFRGKTYLTLPRPMGVLILKLLFLIC